MGRLSGGLTEGSPGALLRMESRSITAVPLRADVGISTQRSLENLKTGACEGVLFLSLDSKERRALFLFGFNLFYFWPHWVSVAARAFLSCGKQGLLSSCGVWSSSLWCDFAAVPGL